MKKNVLVSKLVLVGLFLFPFVSAAADICDSTSTGSLKEIIIWASCLLNSVIPFLVTLAVVAFIWGIIKYYLNPENEEKKKEGKSFIVGGLIALFVMVSMWGIIGIFTNTFSLNNEMPNKYPQMDIK